MGDTPRFNEIMKTARSDGAAQTLVNLSGLCGQLERELSQANTEIARLREALREACEWNWMEPDLPEWVVEKVEAALKGAE